MPWDHQERVIEEHGVTHSEWAVLITAGYYIPLPRDSFVQQAVWEVNNGDPYDDVNEASVVRAIDTCLTRNWIALTAEGHVERERNVLGVYTGASTTYPRDGIVLTEDGHNIHNSIAIASYGREYFAS